MAIIAKVVMELIGYNCGQCALINKSITNHELTGQPRYSLPSEHLLTYKMDQQMAVYSAHLCRLNSYPLHPRRATLIKAKIEGVKSGCSNALKLGKPINAATPGLGTLGVLTTLKTSILVIPAQVQVNRQSSQSERTTKQGDFFHLC